MITRNRKVPLRRRESGWVLPSALIMSTMMVSLTVTYARHAVLAKTRLVWEQGARESEEDSRSGYERARQNMRLGFDIGEGVDADEVDTPIGNTVKTELTKTGQFKRELRINARRDNDEEAFLRVDAEVVPSSTDSSSTKRTRLTDDVGGEVMIAGNLTIISGSSSYVGTEMAGLFLLEDGSELTLDDVVLRGTILTRAAVFSGNSPSVGANRPRVNIDGDLRILAGNPEVSSLDEVAICGPDLVVDASPGSRIEIDGAVVAEELNCPGRGALRGPVVTRNKLNLSADVSRPGSGRGAQEWPDAIEPGGAEIVSMAFATEPIPQIVLDAMSNVDLAAEKNQ